jgi:hypothetical protein
VLGNILIIAENDIDLDMDGFIDDPDDEGSQPAGSLTFVFATPIVELGIDLIDVEPEAGEQLFELSFFSGAILVGTLGWSELVQRDASIEFGDNSANRVAPVTAGELGVTSFDRVALALGGSGGADNLTFTQIPEPGTLALVALGLLATAGLRGRRSCGPVPAHRR